jgi:hypothetical protein
VSLACPSIRSAVLPFCLGVGPSHSRTSGFSGVGHMTHTSRVDLVAQLVVGLVPVGLESLVDLDKWFQCAFSLLRDGAPHPGPSLASFSKRFHYILIGTTMSRLLRCQVLP